MDIFDQSKKKSSDTKLQISNDRCLPNLLWEQVLRRPEAIAVICEQGRLTYRELATSSSGLAKYLQHLGTVSDECVGIFVEPSLELMVGVWGILLAGSAYLPLSPEYPEERLRYMIEDAHISTIFCQNHLKERLVEIAPPKTKVVTLDDAVEFALEHGDAAKQDMWRDLRSDGLAYIIYTSGSTGNPKGVMIEHQSIVNQLDWLQNTYKLNQDSNILQKTPMSFDAAQWEILAPVFGSTVVIGSPGIYRDPEAMIKTIVDHNVTTLQCVPTLLQALIDTDDFHDCTSLTQIFSGGETLSKLLAKQCLETLPKCDLINLYGPTECTINASAYKVEKETLNAGSKAVSIGMPVLNTQFYILDDQRMQVPAGKVGELYIGGIQLARGYLNRPDLTEEKFVKNPFLTDGGSRRLYRTGDLAFQTEDGNIVFAGRTDNQVKLRGYRVELDEIRLAIEAHDWVKNAAMLIKNDTHTGFQNLISCIELNPREAALMDQGIHGAHHQSKESRLQVKAQLSSIGCRDALEIQDKEVVDLAGKTPGGDQQRRVFARKTYRFFEGGGVSRADITQLLGKKPHVGAGTRSLDSLSFTEFGEMLRYFGQFHSAGRLLPKYGYASPGALYATQMYFELNQIAGMKSGHYYYHPAHHQLVLMGEIDEVAAPHIKIHFMGKKRAIQPVYQNNILEVLEIETGHVLGLFDNVLPDYGLKVGHGEFCPEVRDKLECVDEDYYLGSFEIEPQCGTPPEDMVNVFVQTHPGKVADLATGQYRFKEGRFERISDEIILKKHVIAINQQVYENSSFGISMISRESRSWARYIALGRKLQNLQMNDLNLGFMSSGYSSKSGNDLPSAKRIARILSVSGDPSLPFYFCIGGSVSNEQRFSKGMKEDAVHMKGPTEMIKDSLFNLLPNYMVPNKIVLMDKLPLTDHGKIDHKALAASKQVNAEAVGRPFVAPRTSTEKRIGKIWQHSMKSSAVSVQDDFFESGGNSLIAVSLINKVNKELGCCLPLQVLFDAPTVEKLSRKVDGKDRACVSRLVRLASAGSKSPVYCWPGLGGYPMNLRLLANRIDIDRPFYGVQAHGINQGETPLPNISEMAAKDIEEIVRVQPDGPYTLWGYSFGARVAFEAAYQLLQSGKSVDNLFLIAPGMPKARTHDEAIHGNEPTYANKAFVTILFSVFAHSITSPGLDDCLMVAKDEESFAAFICARYKNLDPDLVKRIIRIVSQTYEFKYTFSELAERQLKVPITIFKADGDDYSFIENSQGYSEKAPTVVDLKTDHYSMLKKVGINELASVINRRLQANQPSKKHRKSVEIAQALGG